MTTEKSATKHKKAFQRAIRLINLNERTYVLPEALEMAHDIVNMYREIQELNGLDWLDGLEIRYRQL